MVLQKNTNGTGANLMLTSGGQAVAGTFETGRLTRSPAGSFTAYINSTLVDGITAGTNPVTNTVFTAANFFVLELDAGDKVRNFKFRLGDVTPTQVP